ncbi:TonB family protein [Acinetobacter courvalinii]|jgi:protein TonB|uniref:Protein TonB n=1 Tax=Acinetobacter courvalinii TaxID=280147 RepID=A0AA42L863_9GAMM|nr:MULTISPECIES: energy transducer TonB [Acinetobacter]EXB45970.1 tonB family C-terminal domain protein [Acinetobacter baumannii 146457]EYT18626.1 tonB family C-terminal domain protein [Acinetobacter sp. 1000160]MCU4392391.1 TonB family protein [Acinetobacter courvalinii]MDH0564848.1 TonB family protein [Acinetobacter courvalinii]MDR2062176.1 TonB family protein [Acinetobacter sp.]
MSQSPATFNTPHPMKKKIITALVAVVIGHVGVLWAVSHMKTMELKPVEKEPLKVKFVKIKEPPKPEPPKPKEKPKPEPKKEVKEVKVVEKPMAPPPKKIEKVQQVKEAPKPVLQKTEPKVEPKVETTVVTTKVTEKVVEKPQPVQEVVKPQPAADPSPKRVSIGGSGVQWSRSPKLSVTAKDLDNQTRSVMVMIEADEKGKITNARITRSSGLPNLDEKVLRAVKNAKFKPYMENGVAYPIRAEQPFDLSP